MNNIMRQIGRKEEAFQYVWNQVKLAFEAENEDKKFEMPDILKLTNQHERPRYTAGETEIQVVCVKYGTKYGADYVNNLYTGFK